MANAAELRELDDDELYGRLADSRRELLNLRFQLATGQLDNVARLGLVRKDVARILTLLRDREIATAEGRDAGPVLRPVRELADAPTPRRRARAKADEEAGGDVGAGDVADDEVDDVAGDEIDADGAEAEEDE